MVDKVQVAYTLWHILKTRCNVVVGRKELDILATIRRIKMAMTDYLSIQEHKPNIKGERGVIVQPAGLAMRHGYNRVSFEVDANFVADDTPLLASKQHWQIVPVPGNGNILIWSYSSVVLMDTNMELLFCCSNGSRVFYRDEEKGDEEKDESFMLFLTHSLNLILWSSPTIQPIKKLSQQERRGYPSMNVKFDNNCRTCSLVLAIAAVLDPQFKFDFVEFSYNTTYGNDAARIHPRMIHNALTDIFNECSSNMYSEAFFNDTNSSKLLNAEENTIEFFHRWYNSKRNVNIEASRKSGLDQYVQEPIISSKLEFDILAWWCEQDSSFPILGRMVRDFLAIPKASIIAGSTFNEKVVMDNPIFSGLDPQIIEATICDWDWLESPKERGVPPNWRPLRDEEKGDADPLVGSRYGSAELGSNQSAVPGDSTNQDMRFCHKCNQFKPPRTHHCSVFTHFLRQHFISLSLLRVFMEFFNNGEIDETPGTLAATSITFVLNTVFALSILGFLMIHITLVGANTTTIEAYEKKSTPKWRYDLGWKKKFEQELGTEKKFWFIPAYSKDDLRRMPSFQGFEYPTRPDWEPPQQH
ncbi:hypothetical protein CRYUN_Cryun12cG0035100 [Craigia yunnanensis]